MELAQSDQERIKFAEGQMTVVIIDDEASICSTLAGILEDESFDVSTALTSSEGLALVESLRPNLVFLDVWMPESDGIETLQQIKKISPETQVVMISGHATISTALEATKLGAFDFLEKPLSLESVVSCSWRALEKQTGVQSSERPSDFRLVHPGICTDFAKGRDLGQRTLKESVVLYGQCLHSGQKSGLVLEPLPANSGIHFARMGRPNPIPAYADFVESTDLATTLRSGEVSAATIEHLMAALHARSISNLLIKCNGEVPIFDGSAAEFCRVIDNVGVVEQEGSWFEIAVNKKITFKPDRAVRSSGSEDRAQEEISIEPYDGFAVTYELNYPKPVGRQLFEYECRDWESFSREVAPARTFGFLRDVERMQRAGLAAGGRLNNFILIGDDGVVNTELRFADELARHKVLDIIGDIFLCGRPLRGKITARMTGHADNIQLLRKIIAESSV